jgi:hypothetical protein
VTATNQKLSKREIRKTRIEQILTTKIENSKGRGIFVGGKEWLDFSEVGNVSGKI